MMTTPRACFQSPALTLERHAQRIVGIDHRYQRPTVGVCSTVEQNRSEGRPAGARILHHDPARELRS
jgi:hypothetical protein